MDPMTEVNSGAATAIQNAETVVAEVDTDIQKVAGTVTTDAAKVESSYVAHHTALLIAIGGIVALVAILVTAALR